MPWRTASTTGKRVLPSVTAASGVWRLGEVGEARGDGLWPSAGDPVFSDVTLLLADSLTDQSLAGQTVTASGNAAISTTEVKYGTHSIAFDGSGDKLTVADKFNGLHNKTTDYTIEFWLYATATSGRRCIMETAAASATSGFLLEINSGAIAHSIYRGVSGSLTSASGGSISTNTWYHVAVSVTTSTVKIYVDGSEAAATSWSLAGSASDAAVDLSIGADTISVVGDFAGYLDDIRITEGTARYTAAFTPPIAAHPTS